MTQESAGDDDPNGTIIAGSGSSERSFRVRMSALKKSSIINEWIEDPEYLPSSMCKNGALLFSAVDPEVMETLIAYLEHDETEQWTFYRGRQGVEKLEAPIDHIFYTRVYKLALSLAVEGLCTAALHRIQAKKPTTEVFTAIVLEAESGRLIDSKRFREWIIGYIRQNAEQLSESRIFREAIEGGGIKAWAICSVLMKGLKDVDTGSVEKSEDKNDPEYLKGDLLTPPPSSSKRTSSFTHHGTSYSGTFHRSPTALKSTPQAAEKKTLAGLGKRKLHATVEDATVSEDEEQDTPTLSETKTPLKKARS